jgi:phosphate transport system substrate-binding protein
MSPLLHKLAEAYALRAPLHSVDIVDLGNQYGLEELETGNADFAMASWLPPGSEAGNNATAIARDGIAIIVHPTNPIEGVGLLQLQDLFSGRTYEWKELGGRSTQATIQPISREDGSGTRQAFENMVMLDSDVTPRAIVAPSNQAAVQYVAEYHNAIAYVSMAFVTPDVKVLTVEGEVPTPETVGNASYPLTRELWLVIGPDPSEAAEEFVQFALSPAGQEIAGKSYGRIR